MITNRNETTVLSFTDVFKKIKKLQEPKETSKTPNETINQIRNETSKESLNDKPQRISDEAASEALLFIENIKNQKGPKTAEYLQEIIGMGSRQQNIAHHGKFLHLPQNLRLQVTHYKDDFNISTYLELLPYMHLAYAYEKNGSPEEHAFKLAVLFSTSEDALNYLYKHIKEGIHTNCLFDLPNKQHCNFSLWQKLAKKHHSSNKDMFLKLLGQAAEIESMIKQVRVDESIIIDYERFPLLKQGKKEKWSTLSKVIKEIETKHAKWKKVRKNQDNQSGALVELSKEVWADKISLLKLYAMKYPFNENTPLPIIAWFQEVVKHQDESYKAMLSHGLTKKDYDKFKELDRSIAGKNIPDLTIDGEELGYPGYYLRKLDVQNNKDAVLATYLGKLTNCCQSFSNLNGEPCTIHGLTNCDGGFYIVGEGNLNDIQTLDEPIVAQSWVWRSKSGALVFDSVEIKSNPTEKEEGMVIQLYRHLAKKLVLENHASKVNCGAKSGISYEIGFESLWKTEEFIDYKGYSDSKIQYCVFSKDKEFYLYQDDFLIQGRVDTWISSIMEEKAPYVTSVAFCELLNWMIAHPEHSEKLHKRITEIAKSHHREYELEDFLEKIKYFVEHKASNLNFKDLVSWIDQKTFYINTINSNDKTLLMCAIEAKQEEVVQELIKKGVDYKRKDNMGNNVLFYCVNQPTMFRALLDLIPEKEIFLQETNMKGNTIFHEILPKPSAFVPLFEILTKKEQYIVLNEQNDFGTTIFNRLINSPCKTLIKVLEFFSYEESLALLNKDNNMNRLIFSRFDKFIAILKMFSENQRLSFLKERSNDSELLCDALYREPEKFIEVLKLCISESQRVSLLQEKNNLNQTIFYQIVFNNIIQATDLTLLIPENESIELLREKKGESSIWDIDFINHEYFIKWIPVADRLNFFMEENNVDSCLSMLSRATYFSEKFTSILKLFSNEEMFSLLKEEFFLKGDYNPTKNTTLLKQISYLPEIFIATLQLFNEEDRLRLIKEKDSKENTILCEGLTSSPQTVMDTLTLFSKKNKVKAIKEIYYNQKNSLSGLIFQLDRGNSAIEMSERRLLAIYCMLLEESRLINNTPNMFFSRVDMEIRKNIKELILVFENESSDTTLQAAIRMFLEKNTGEAKYLCKRISEKLPENIKIEALFNYEHCKYPAA